MDSSSSRNVTVPPSPGADAGLYSAWRLRWYPRVLLLAVTAAFLIAVLGDLSGRASGRRLSGDFPAFYGAGRIVASGDGSLLYDWNRQAAAQKDLYPEEANQFLAFAYPPFVAVAYWPFALLPFTWSFILHTLGMAAALFGAIQLLRPMLPRLDRNAFGAFCVALLFLPLFRAIGGGQNTALTLLIVAATWRLAWAGKDLPAGLVLGLLLFKPQFALPLIGLFLINGRWRIVAGSALTAAMLYGVSAAVGGVEWPWWWWEQIAQFQRRDHAVNAANSVGWLGFSEAVMGAGEPLALIIGWTLIGLTIAGLIWLWIGTDRYPLALRMGVTAVGLILIAPHAMFYDTGLVILSFAVLADEKGREALPLLTGLWFLGFADLFANFLGFNPLFFLLLVTLWLAVRLLGASRPPGLAAG